MWGGEQSLLSIAEGCNAAGVDVELWCVSPVMAQAWRDRTGLAATVRPLRNRRDRKNASWLLPLARAQRGAAVVTFDVELLPVMVLLRPLWKVRAVSSILDLHVSLTGRLTPGLTRFLSRWIDGCIAVSEYVAQQVRGRTATTVVWRPMVEGPVQTRVRQPSDPLRVGVVGRIDPEKNVIGALEMLSRVSPLPRVIVRGAAFAGDESYVQSVIERGAALFGANFGFEGRVAREDAVRDLDVMLLMNTSEPSGRVVAEAQLEGVVPIVPSAGGAREFVEDGVTGLVFVPGDPEGVAAAIARLHQGGTLKAISESSRAFALTAYEQGAQVDAYMAAIMGGGGDEGSK